MSNSLVTYPFLELLQNVDFNQSLLMESLLIANNLYSAKSAELVVNTPHNLTETSLSKYIDDFVAVS
jgi:hypothetical protein